MSDVAAPRAFRCLNCGAGGAAWLYRSCPDRYLGLSPCVDYVTCDACGLVQQHPAPSDTAGFYADYPVHSRKGRLHGAARRLMVSAPYFDASHLAPGSVLVDWGCGDGWYLASLAGRGLSLAGYEPNGAQAEALTAELGVPVAKDAGGLEARLGGSVDVITMHFVLEHVTDLDGALASASRLLKSGGAVHISVPDARSWEARLFRTYWHGLDPPRHVSFPDEAVLASVASRHDMRVAERRARPFANGVAGSLATLAGGRFRYPLYLAALPLGLLASWIAPSGVVTFRLVKHGAAG